MFDKLINNLTPEAVILSLLAAFPIADAVKAYTIAEDSYAKISQAAPELPQRDRARLAWFKANRETGGRLDSIPHMIEKNTSVSKQDLANKGIPNDKSVQTALNAVELNYTN
ncbi:MAG: hypothetical protein AAB276_06085 [Pseudomonadota bacterium]